MSDQATQSAASERKRREAVEIEAHVKSRLGRRVRGFQLTVSDEGLILRGCSDTFYFKQLAQHAVMEATILIIRANEIEVADTTSNGTRQVR